MEQLSSDLINKHWLLAAIVVGISLISGLIKIIRAVIDTHDEIYLKRDLKRLVELKACVSANSAVSEFIDKRIEEEAFLLASGIRASNEEAAMILQLYRKNFLTNSQVKRIARYLKPANGKIAVEFGWFEKCGVFYSFWASIILFLIGFSGLVPLIQKPTLVNVVFAIAIFGTALLMIKFVGSDFQQYKTLYYAWCRLKADNQIANSDNSIKTTGIYTPPYSVETTSDCAEGTTQHEKI